MSQLWKRIWGFIRSMDLFLILTCFSLTAISMLCLWSFYVTGQRSLRTMLVQGIGALLGIAFAVFISLVDYETLAHLWKIYVPVAVALVVLTYFIGTGGDGGDDKAWLDLGITTFQPSEILKLAFIYTFSLHLSKVKEQINQLRPFLLLCLHGAVPCLLIALQGDFGTALVFLFIFMVMMFSAGLSAYWIVIGIIGLCFSFPLVWRFLLPDYLKERFFVAWHPEDYLTGAGAGWQQYRGKIALGSGGLLGRGLGSDELYNGVYAAHNDFILSYIGQTMGYLGIVITLLLITTLCVKILITAQMAHDVLGSYICVGVFAMFLFQAIINIGMVLCVLPVVGITLPFLSAGGTSIMVSYAAIGMVLGVYRQSHSESMFD